MAAAAQQQQQGAVPMQGVQLPPAGVMPAGMPLQLLPPGLKQSADRPQVCFRGSWLTVLWGGSGRQRVLAELWDGA